MEEKFYLFKIQIQSGFSDADISLDNWMSQTCKIRCSKDHFIPEWLVSRNMSCQNLISNQILIPLSTETLTLKTCLAFLYVQTLTFVQTLSPSRLQLRGSASLMLLLWSCQGGKDGSRGSVELSPQELRPRFPHLVGFVPLWRHMIVRYFLFSLPRCTLGDPHTCVWEIVEQPGVWKRARNDQEVRHQHLPAVLPHLLQGYWLCQGASFRLHLFQNFFRSAIPVVACRNEEKQCFLG